MSGEGLWVHGNELVDLIWDHHWSKLRVFKAFGCYLATLSKNRINYIDRESWNWRLRMQLELSSYQESCRSALFKSFWIASWLLSSALFFSLSADRLSLLLCISGSIWYPHGSRVYMLQYQPRAITRELSSKTKLLGERLWLAHFRTDVLTALAKETGNST